MAGSTTVRRLEDRDHERVAAVLIGAYEEHVRAEPGYAAVLTDLVRRDRDAEVWVAESGGDVVGTVTFCPPGSPFREIARDDESEFRMLAVDPAAQGRGAGRALTRLVLDETRRLGLAAVALSSTTTMLAAHHVYESLGFVRDPDRDWTPAPGVDLLAYRRELTDAD